MNDVTPAWLPVPGWDGYQVSSDGQVKGKRGRLLKQFQRPDGYMQVHPYRDGIRKSRKVHLLVVLAFIGPPPDGMGALHRDGNPANNVVGNLYYGTQSDNALDTVRHGRHPQANQTHCINDHEFTPANTHVAYGRRNCRACGAARARASYRKRAARKAS